MLLTKALVFDLMEDALRAPVRLDCGTNVERARRRCYRVRQHFEAQGDYRFVILRFLIDGASLVITKHPDPESKLQRHRLRLLRELRAFAVEYGTTVGSRIGEIARAENSEHDEN